MAQMHNLVVLNDGIICYTQAGDQNQDNAAKTISAIRLLAEGMSEARLLADYTDSGEMDEEAVQMGFYALQAIPLNKVAIIGASPFLKELVTTMAKAAVKSKIIHFAKNREEAIDWLKK